MQQRRLGIIILAIGILLGIVIFQLLGSYYREAELLGCFSGRNCQDVQGKIGISHFVFGILGFILSLGIYLLVFSAADDALLRRIEKHEEKIGEDERFSLMLRGLDENEKTVLPIIRDTEGITQATLRLKTSFSKARLSYVLQSLEKKGIITRVPKGKNLVIKLRNTR